MLEKKGSAPFDPYFRATPTGGFFVDTHGPASVTVSRMNPKSIGQTALIVVGTVFLLEVIGQNFPAADIRGLASHLNFRG